MNTIEILKAVCGAPGVSGAEGNTAAVIASFLEKYTGDVRTDALGNLIATLHPGQ